MRSNDAVLGMLEGGFKNGIWSFLQQTRNLYVYLLLLFCSNMSHLLFDTRDKIKKDKDSQILSFIIFNPLNLMNYLSSFLFFVILKMH